MCCRYGYGVARMANSDLEGKAHGILGVNSMECLA